MRIITYHLGEPSILNKRNHHIFFMQMCYLYAKLYKMVSSFDPTKQNMNKMKRSIDSTSTAYAVWLSELKQRIRDAQRCAAIAVNTELVRLYWHIGHEILLKQETEGWGTKVVERLAKDLQSDLPGMTGLSRANLMYMRAFASAWSENEIVQAPLGQLTWYHHLTLLEKLDSKSDRLAYAALAVKNGWSRNTMVHHIELNTAQRIGHAQTNFACTLPPADSDLAEQSLKDPYKLEFLGLSECVKENRLRKVLVDRVADSLLELGTGFAYVGKAVPLEVGGDSFEMDLLFYHLKLHCYVVVELKTGKLKPEHIGQLGFYMTAVDKQVKMQQDNPTIGLLLCKSRNKVVAEYALETFCKPIGIASYQLSDEKRKNAQAILPDIRQLEEALNNAKDK